MENSDETEEQPKIQKFYYKCLYEECKLSFKTENKLVKHIKLYYHLLFLENKTTTLKCPVVDCDFKDQKKRKIFLHIKNHLDFTEIEIKFMKNMINVLALHTDSDLKKLFKKPKLPKWTKKIKIEISIYDIYKDEKHKPLIDSLLPFGSLLFKGATPDNTTATCVIPSCNKQLNLRAQFISHYNLLTHNFCDALKTDAFKENFKKQTKNNEDYEKQILILYKSFIETYKIDNNFKIKNVYLHVPQKADAVLDLPLTLKTQKNNKKDEFTDDLEKLKYIDGIFSKEVDILDNDIIDGLYYRGIKYNVNQEDFLSNEKFKFLNLNKFIVCAEIIDNDNIFISTKNGNKNFKVFDFINEEGELLHFDMEFNLISKYKFDEGFVFKMKGFKENGKIFLNCLFKNGDMKKISIHNKKMVFSKYEVEKVVDFTINENKEIFLLNGGELIKLGQGSTILNRIGLQRCMYLIECSPTKLYISSVEGKIDSYTYNLEFISQESVFKGLDWICYDKKSGYILFGNSLDGFTKILKPPTKKSKQINVLTNYATSYMTQTATKYFFGDYFGQVSHCLVSINRCQKSSVAFGLIKHGKNLILYDDEDEVKKMVRYLHYNDNTTVMFVHNTTINLYAFYKGGYLVKIPLFKL